jgi:hypothetical protein
MHLQANKKFYSHLLRKKPGAYSWLPIKPDCYKMQKLKTGKKTTVVRIEDSLLRQACTAGFVLSLLKL